MSDAERRPLRQAFEAIVGRELAYRPQPLEERGLAQRR